MAERDAFPVVVHVLLWRDDTLLLLRRANTGFLDGYFAPPGGHQQRGESVSEAAARECEEEAGVIPTHLDPVCVLAYCSPDQQGLNFIFETDDWRGEPGVNEPDLFDGCVWSPSSRLPEPVAPWLSRMLEHRAEGRWFAEF